ncbi:AAA family ATPase [Pseudoruminococcus massiliensis]|uniref:AAA family ATPase n=1 Tax=Pseudoruminococcus massiliensis TaxID=2086583 RepID=UPI000D0F167E|nr:AAA family ATPase [Pseudoruminococcus massiliensis]
MQRKVPSAIENITLNRATFTDVPVADLTFVNFFYGNNGAGKSSIAHAIEEDDGVVWADGKSADDYDVLVYNQDFINENFVNYGDLKGVFIFGEEDIEAKKRIAELTEEKKKKSDAKVAAGEDYKQKTAGVDAALTQFQDACFSKTADIRKRFEKCMDGKKQKRNFAEAVLGEKTPKEHDLPELERLYGVAFDDTARAYAEFKKAGATTYGSLPGKEMLDKVIVSSSDTPFARFLKALGSTASDWVRDGHTHFSGSAGGKCPYCQQKLPANFENEIAATFDAQYQQDIRDLGQFQSTYGRETADIVRVLQTNTTDAMPSLDLRAYQEKLSLLESKFEVNRQRIAEKVKEPSKTVSLEDTDTLLLEIGAMIDGINKLIKANNDVIAAKKSSKEKCKTEIMQYLAFMLADEVTSYKDEVARLEKEIKEITERGTLLRKEISELTREISELNKHNANTEAAIDSINKILRDSGFQGFSIRAKDGVENVYEIVRENGTVAENLSEGERNFIAFLYFYHRVRGSMNSEELKEKIVVIDDPVSSMDSTALFIVSAIVREMINVCRNNTEYLNPQVPGDYIKQLFILTHNVYFHREVTYQQVGYYNCTSFYMIRKNDNVSTVKLCKRQNKEIPSEEENYNPVQNSYAALWDELRDLHSTIPALNVMRRILEYYFLQLCGYEGSDLRSIVLEKKENRKKFIKQVEGEKPDMTDYQLASSLLTYINNPNGISDGLNYVEDCEDAEAYKRVFQMIFDALGQSQHYKMMTGQRTKS